METNQGTIIDMGTKPAPVVTRPGGVDGELSVTITGNKVTKTSLPSDVTSGEQHPEEGRVEDFHALTTKPFDTGVQPTEQAPTTNKEQKPDSEKTPEELIAEKKQQLTAYVELLGENLTKEEKAQLISALLADYLNDDKEQDNPNKFEDTFAELTRLVMLILTLLMLLITSDKTTFSGKDLNLPETPPEGAEDNPLTKLINGKDSKESWNAFRKEVENIKDEIPFSDFMSLVLAANERNSIKKLKLKNKYAKNSIFSKARRRLQGARKQPKVVTPARRAA